LYNWISRQPYGVPNLLKQKFLFFYECLSKVDGDEYDFSELKGFKNGPVFADVYSRNRYNQSAFLAECASANAVVDERRVKLAAFLVQALGSKLSDFTHKLNIWSAKKDRILRDEPYVVLSDVDFTPEDAEVFKGLERSYPESYTDSVYVKNIQGKAFVIPNENREEAENCYDEFYAIAEDENFESPVFVTFLEDGGVFFD